MKLTYANKVAINENAEISDINKVTDNDMNEIKAVVNNNDDELITINTKLTNATTYSTDEIRIGTWMNKPLYRKVIRKDTATSSGANPNISTGVAFSLIGEIVELKVLGKQSNSNTWFVASSNLSGQEVFGCYLSENNIFIRNYWALEKIICILEYTKTTD